MARVTRGRLLGVCGGLLGIAAIFLPWGAVRVLGTVTELSAFSFFEALGEIVSAVSENMGSEAQTILPGLYVAIAGWIVLLVASFISLLRPSFGVFMFTGTVLATAGLTDFGRVAPLGGAPLSIAYGALVAFAASILVIAGYLGEDMTD